MPKVTSQGLDPGMYNTAGSLLRKSFNTKACHRARPQGGMGFLVPSGRNEKLRRKRWEVEVWSVLGQSDAASL